MQAITPELEAILKDHFQAGAQGFHGKLVVDGVDYYPTSIDIDHSLQTMASQLTAVFTNENGEVGLAADVFPDNGLFTAFAWYGDEANAVQVFTGFFDKIAEHRDPRTVTVTARDWAKPLLVQDILVTAPQGAEEEGAVRTSANFVYLNVDVAEIVRDLLNKAGYPAGSRRKIQPTNFVVDEWDGRDGSSYADAIGELADLVAYNAFADELGVFRFQPNGLVDTPVDTDTPPDPVYTYTSGVDIVALDPVRDDYDTKTRVRAVGPYTTLKNAWTELWHTNHVVHPTGVRYDPDFPTYIFVADGVTKKVYSLRQSDRAILSSTGVLVTTLLNGLSGDPADSTVYWTLDTPWLVTGIPTLNKIRKHLKSDNSVLDTFTLANQRWTDMKVGDDAIWAMNFSTNKLHKLSKVDGTEIASYTITYEGVAQTQPVGVAIDGDKLFLAFYNHPRMLQSTTAAPSTITRVLHFSGTQSLGGDIDTTTHTELYATAAELSLTYKYTLKEPFTRDVSVEVVNAELEAALGVELDTEAEIRRLVLHLDVVTSYAQATEAAARWLDKLDQFRNVLDMGIIGNPALQRGDMVRVVDPVTELNTDFQVDTYRSSLNAAGTYLGVLALVPWTSSYGGPGTTELGTTVINAGAGWKALLLSTETLGTVNAEPAGWKDPGFDDSAWEDTIDRVINSGIPAMSRPGSLAKLVAEKVIIRKDFVVYTSDLDGDDVRAQFGIDNGGIFYVNGVEVKNLGGATPTTNPSSSNYWDDHLTLLPRSLFSAGTNCVAVLSWNEDDGVDGGGSPGGHKAGLHIEMPVQV